MALDLKLVKLAFLDTVEVQKQADQATLAGLKKIGAFVRTRARSSIRKRKKSAPPGRPPHSHRGDLKRLIFFTWDPSTRSVVVGPVKFESKQGGMVPAPQLLEHGGDVVRSKLVGVKTTTRVATPRQKAAFRRKVKAGAIVVKKKERVNVRMTYRGNAFMLPAAAAEQPRFGELFRQAAMKA